MIFKKQCKLVKNDAYFMTWVDEKFAKKGKEVEVEFDSTLKERGWIVSEVFDRRIDENTLKDRERDYLRTRLASDI